MCSLDSIVTHTSFRHVPSLAHAHDYHMHDTCHTISMSPKHTPRLSGAQVGFHMATLESGAELLLPDFVGVGVIVKVRS